MIHICGIFHHGIFRSCATANCAPVKYSTVKYSTVALWNQVHLVQGRQLYWKAGLRLWPRWAGGEGPAVYRPPAERLSGDHAVSITATAHRGRPHHTSPHTPPLPPYSQPGISHKLNCSTSSTESMEWKRDVELQLRGATRMVCLCMCDTL